MWLWKTFRRTNSRRNKKKDHPPNVRWIEHTFWIVRRRLFWCTGIRNFSMVLWFFQQIWFEHKMPIISRQSSIYNLFQCLDSINRISLIYFRNDKRFIVRFCEQNFNARECHHLLHLSVKILHFFKLITPYDAWKTTTTLLKSARTKQNKWLEIESLCQANWKISVI